LLSDTIPAYAWSARPDGSVDFVNQRVLEFTGRSKEEVPGWDWGSVVHPDDLARFRRRVALCPGRLGNRWKLKCGCGGGREISLVVDPERCPCEMRAATSLNGYGTAVDIEERRQARAEISAGFWNPLRMQ